MLKLSSLQDFPIPTKSSESNDIMDNDMGYHIVVGQLRKKKGTDSVPKRFCCGDFNFELLLIKWSATSPFF